MEFASESAIQRSNVTPLKTAILEDRVFAKPGHLIHIAKHDPTRSLGDQDRPRVELAEGIRRKIFFDQFVFNESYHRGTYRRQLGFPNIGGEDREQGATVDHQKTLSTFEPQEVGVPVVFAGH